MTSMDKENSDTIRNKGGKETFIFGSWKCRNSRKTRVNCNDLEREKSPYGKREVKCNEDSGPSNGYNVNSTEEQHEGNVSRRAISVYDQLHERDFWCPRCNGKMEEPRLLACLHSVCNNCVNQLMTTDHSDVCPICEFPLPRTGSPAPPPHYSLQHRLVVYAVRRRLSHRAICCEFCAEEVEASRHCPQCLSNLCEYCAQEHEAERRHRIRPLWEARRIRRVTVCLEHPANPLEYHCLACRRVTCRECAWSPEHRGHATEDATTAGARATASLLAALRKARILLDGLLAVRCDAIEGDAPRPRTAFGMADDSAPRNYHCRSRSTISSHSKEARERIQEFARLRKARYLIDAIFVGEDLLANGSDVEILSLKRIILKRLKFLGVPIDAQARLNDNSSAVKLYRGLHAGIYHCCTFCSSSGKKEVTCACNGTMPGGYKGCGHGHPGHPGVHHWSCCGSIYRDSVCLFPQKPTYKITL